MTQLNDAQQRLSQLQREKRFWENKAEIAANQIEQSEKAIADQLEYIEILNRVRVVA